MTFTASSENAIVLYFPLSSHATCEQLDWWQLGFGSRWKS
eukprot:SAG31_NODE_2856_length_4992_cov_2.079910_3_plen_40_part_00